MRSASAGSSSSVCGEARPIGAPTRLPWTKAQLKRRRRGSKVLTSRAVAAPIRAKLR